MNQDFQRQARIRRAAAILAIVIVLASVMVIDHIKKESTSTVAVTMQPATAATTPTSTPSSSTSSTTSTTSPYKDGTYAAQSQYSVPHSYETIKVTLSVQNGVITSAQIANSEGDPQSADFQEGFASEYKSYVVGKSLSGLSLSTVSGASDTTSGFNQALNSIRSQAQA